MPSPIHSSYVDFEAFAIEEGWKLYGLEQTCSELILDAACYKHTMKSLAKKYVFNNDTGKVYVITDNTFVPVGQFGQETEHPYISMNDNGYIRLLPQYNSIIKETDFAKQCNQSYLDAQKTDI
jgi:hypothetical protein